MEFDKLFSIMEDRKHDMLIDKIIHEVDESDYSVCWHDQDTELWKVVIHIYEKYRRTNN